MNTSARATRRRAWNIFFATIAVFMLLVAVQSIARYRALEPHRHDVESTTTTSQLSTSPICKNVITRAISHDVLEQSLIERRRDFPALALSTLTKMLDAEMLKDPPFDICSFAECKRAEIRGWSGLNHGYGRWEMMGEPVVKCPQVRSFGSGDEEKRFCWADEFDQTPCVVFSIGSANAWSFETDLVANTHCHVHTFDCTVDGQVPPTLVDRVTFHKYCIGNSSQGGELFKSLDELIEIAGVSQVTLLKMDIEGFEWQVINQIVDSALQARTDIFPMQIAVEMHYLTQFPEVNFHGRDLSPGEIYLYFESLFQRGGYVLAERRDNRFCAHCSEILLLKVMC